MPFNPSIPPPPLLACDWLARRGDELFEILIEENGLEPGDIWNIDETGFRVGCISWSSLVVTWKEVKKAYLARPEDQTLVTSIKCVSRDRGLIDLVIILL
jgi:hypothetical protein